jgi:hypothetical protein
MFNHPSIFLPIDLEPFGESLQIFWESFLAIETLKIHLN